VPDSSNLEKLYLNLIVMHENQIVQHTGLGSSAAEEGLTEGIIIFLSSIGDDGAVRCSITASFMILANLLCRIKVLVFKTMKPSK